MQKVAAKHKINRVKLNISVSHQLPSRKADANLLTATFVQRETQSRIEAKGNELKRENGLNEPKPIVFLGDGDTFFRETFAIYKRHTLS